MATTVTKPSPVAPSSPTADVMALSFLVHPSSNSDTVGPSSPKSRKCSETQSAGKDDCDYHACHTACDHSHRSPTAGPRHYRCDFKGCEKTFSQSGGLIRHRRTHTGDKPYTCRFEGCGRTFAESGHLTRHHRSHTGEKPYVCTFGCGKSFATSYHLLRHQRIHTGDRPYKCKYPNCPRAFTQSGGLQRHVRTHDTDSQEISNCESCGKEFSKVSLLLIHQWKDGCSANAKVTGGKPSVAGRKRRNSASYHSEPSEDEDEDEDEDDDE
eukprot:c1122_g1_i1.p1 GENE.c1122_g1_i1~~c1122_g1_i1.p1  ORF type:complete len:276 (-),score=46.42 c1122_g1_i1:33-836(-)